MSPALRQITIDVQKVGGINLGQGVCQLPVPPIVLEKAAEAAQNGTNRYTNPRGLLALREAVSEKARSFNRIADCDPEQNVLITCGATGAFEAVCAALLDPGDEVAIFEPYYPYHLQALRRYQADVRFVVQRPPHWEVDFDAVRKAVSPRTKLLLLNTPGNPTGKVFTRTELEMIAETLSHSDCFLVTDEIYEYMTFDGKEHVSPASVESLQDRTITISGHSKTFAITGWRIGYAIAPSWIAERMAAFLDAVYVCAPAPLQQAVADGIRLLGSEFYEQLRNQYQTKRDRFGEGLREAGMEPLVPEGAYYMLGSFEGVFPDLNADEFVRHMIQSCGVGAVPPCDFVRDDAAEKWVRFCLAVEDSVLEQALRRLLHLTTKGAVTV